MSEARWLAGKGGYSQGPPKTEGETDKKPKYGPEEARSGRGGKSHYSLY